MREAGKKFGRLQYNPLGPIAHYNIMMGLDFFHPLDGGLQSILCTYYLLHTQHIQPYLKLMQ